MRYLKTLSDKTLMDRHTRLERMRREDRQRFKPNPRGDGYLTKDERYYELITAIGDELRNRWQIL